MGLMRCDRIVSPRLLRATRLLAVLLCALALGCNAWSVATYVPSEAPYGPPPVPTNPVLVTSLDRDFVWDQVVDVVDDYFRIEKEERVRLVGDLLTEGRLDTYPRGGSTLLEPWNNDSSTPYERLESTLQSIRRRALVRVVPAQAGFLVDVQVFKELENVPAPETGAVSLANPSALRNDNALQRVTNPIGGAQPTLGWIPQGRDAALEQLILAQIQARLSGFSPPRPF
jgi:hypothetical protein